MWSDYRFASGFYKSKNLGFGDIMRGTLADFRGCYLHFVNGSMGEEGHLKGVDEFYDKRCETTIRDNHNLIRKSLYYFQVLT